MTDPTDFNEVALECLRTIKADSTRVPEWVIADALRKTYNRGRHDGMKEVAQMFEEQAKGWRDVGSSDDECEALLNAQRIEGMAKAPMQGR